MSERRRAVRREPITVEVNDGKSYEAIPLPWLQRNELGNVILQQYQIQTNEQIKAYVNPEDGIPQLELLLSDKLKDPVEVLKLAYPSVDVEEWAPLTWDEILELIFASCEVNGLEQLKVLIDPNFLTPNENGGISGSGENDQTQADTQKTQSTPDSDLQVSQEMESLNSPTQNLLPSSTSGTDSSGSTDTGTSL